jgi:hypothetical protein
LTLDLDYAATRLVPFLVERTNQRDKQILLVRRVRERDAKRIDVAVDWCQALARRVCGDTDNNSRKHNHDQARTHLSLRR